MKKICRYCGQEFYPCPRVKNQSSCGKPYCRRALKREWQCRKKASDPDYAANQNEAQKAWRARKPRYWQEYRQKHPEYVERNRLKQRERNHALRHPAINNPPSVIAKMDSIHQPTNIDPMAILPGRYRLTRLDEVIAKMDSIIVEISSIPVVPSQTNDSAP